MKTNQLPLVGICLGGVIALWIFAIAFTTPMAGVLPKGLFPLGLAAAVSFALAWVDPKKWKILAASVALPTLLMSALILIALWMEGRFDFGWVGISGVVFSVCLVPSWFAHMAKKLTASPFSTK